MQPIQRQALKTSRGRLTRSAPGLQVHTSPRNKVAIQRLGQFRSASTAVDAASNSGSRILNFLYGSTLLLGLGIGYFYITDTRASAHRYVVVPSLRWIYEDPERAHEVGNYSLKTLWNLGLHPRERGDPDAKGDLAVEVFGTTLRNPVGTSAGIDKGAEIPDPLMAIGPAIIEVGGVTPQPQPGNDKPRVFRLSSQNALINRYGLNSEGADHIAARLRQRVREYASARGLGVDESAEKAVLDGEAGVPPGSLTAGKLLAINIAKNKSTPESDVQAVAEDYVYCAEKLAPYADILVVNVSSPNTPGLRSLQQGDKLRQLLGAVVTAAKSTDRKIKPAVMVKVSPDEDTDEQIAGIAQAVWEAGVDGVIVGNTTNRRPPSIPSLASLSSAEEQRLLEQGGFSGPHLYEKTLALVKKYKKLLDERPPSSSQQPKSEILSNELSKIKDELSAKPGTTSQSAEDLVRASIESGVVPAQNIANTLDAEKKAPLINIPSDKYHNEARPSKDTRSGSQGVKKGKNVPQTDNIPVLDTPKVIFATGGITNGRQVLEILNAGASVAMVYTALVYGGAGTVSRIKDEMRAELKAKKGGKSSR